MKKAAFIIIAFVCSTTNTIAQLSFGPKAGLNRYALTGDDQSYLNALHAGGFVQIPVSRVFAVQPELLFSAEGNEFEENNVKSGQYLGYINIPVMLRATSKGGFYAEAGPQFGFLLSAKNKESASPDADIKKFFKGTNLSVSAGAGYEFKMGLGIGARYNVGLSNLLKDDNPDAMKSIGLQVGLFYKVSASKNKRRTK
jgi:Outer membrane protein beta-barrel domain